MAANVRAWLETHEGLVHRVWGEGFEWLENAQGKAARQNLPNLPKLIERTIERIAFDDASAVARS